MIAPVSPRLSRRSFLVGASAVGATLGSARFGGAAAVAADICGNAGAAPTSVAAVRAPNWDDLKDRLTGPLLEPGDSRFRSFAAPFNLAFDTADQQPCVIALCANRDDVATAVNWARDQDVHPVVRGGGHSYAGYSMGEGLMIDVSLLKRFSWDGSRSQLTVESGARNGDVYNVLRAENRALTHGRCPTVGIAGFLLGGGIGFNMRLHGVGSDNLVASDIVTADGKTLRLSAEENPDLFWACRGGGGGNFGINTAFTLDTVPADRVTAFEIKWATSRDEAEQIAVTLMSALDGVDGRLGSRFRLAQDRTQPAASEAGINVLGQWHGPEREVRALLGGMLALNKPAVRIEERAYWDAQDFLLEWEGPFRFIERSAFLTQKLDAAAIAKAFDGLWQWKGSADPALSPDVRFFQTGGRMNDIAADATAFVHRDSRWLMDLGMPWSANDLPDRVQSNKDWLDGFFAAMSRYGNGGSYQNFADPALTDWRTAYYGTNLTRLRQIKRRYDPNNLFKFDQSIPPAVA